MDKRKRDTRENLAEGILQMLKSQNRSRIVTTHNLDVPEGLLIGLEGELKDVKKTLTEM